MSDLHQILPLWRELHDSRQQYVLATVVQVDGSGYRKPGARMIIAQDGRRAGTLSGGCLEAEVARKAFWHTESGPALQRYSTHPEDGDVPFGMGCGGVIHVFLERSETADGVMSRIAEHFDAREPLAVATVLNGDLISQRLYWSALSLNLRNEPDSGPKAGPLSQLSNLASHAFLNQQSFTADIPVGPRLLASVFVEWLPARPGVFLFGAGDDVTPLVKLAHQMGWFITVLDGRAHLATRARFPEAHQVHVLTPEVLSNLSFRPGDAAALLTHSLQQDTDALAYVLNQQLAYIGVLGPRRRTGQILREIASRRFGASAAEDHAAIWMRRLHAPMGLDLGGTTPAAIALATVAEIQLSMGNASGKPLHTLPAASTLGMIKVPV